MTSYTAKGNQKLLDFQHTIYLAWGLDGAWKGVALDEATQTLLATRPTSTEEAIRLNRALFEAAYAGIIAPNAKN